ncbi:MAG: bifunctional 5,10-methylenetetrahydrofolate dehydrogenase/5,10-methenyltetrahydrofolate cyclohydrolase [Patescibacteria group bacterium]
MIIDGIKIRNEILKEVKKGVSELPFTPVFCDVIVGDDPVSLQYVKMKEKTAESVGILFRSANFPMSTTTSLLIEEIEKLNKIPNMCGIIVQLPLPPHIDTQAVVDAIDQELDVDCLGIYASELFYNNENHIGFPAALACIAVLDSVGPITSSQNIVVLGQGKLVGKPVVHLLKQRKLPVSTIDSRTDNTREMLKNADIIISGIGKGKFITGDMIKEGVIVIDAGTSEDNGAVVGDVDLESVEKVASYVSPTPGGVGPVTVAILLKNVLAVAQKLKLAYYRQAGT